MAQAIDLPRNEEGIATALGILKQQFGDRFHTGQAMRDQHAHTTTYIKPQAPDAVVFPTSTKEVSDIIKVCAAHRVPVIGYGTGTSLEGHVNAPAGGICVDLSTMDKIISVNADDLDCVVQPGVTREQLNTYL
ncbi:MAG: FAD-binding oxidoreductase, partial [Pseudomonadota bacterium]